ncbi:hypothetical protein [Methyloceanibacter superfactus]|jgi:hypothetical protein|nr:hypothetical protein [Methyloceanibacter superfactus]
MASQGAVERHESVTPARGVSLLRLSVPARLAIVAAAVCLLWLAVYWALR